MILGGLGRGFWLGWRLLLDWGDGGGVVSEDEGMGVLWRGV